MARARAGLQFYPRCVVGGQFTGSRIESINHDLVETQIGDKSVVIRLIENNAMRVWLLLPFRVNARATVLDHVDRRQQTSVTEWQDRGVSAVVIGHQNKLAGLIDRQITRSATR